MNKSDDHSMPSLFNAAAHARENVRRSSSIDSVCEKNTFMIDSTSDIIIFRFVLIMLEEGV